MELLRRELIRLQGFQEYPDDNDGSADENTSLQYPSDYDVANNENATRVPIMQLTHESLQLTAWE